MLKNVLSGCGKRKKRIEEHRKLLKLKKYVVFSNTIFRENKR